MNTQPRIREHDAFVEEMKGQELLTDELLFRWSLESHSVSGHFLAMYSIARGIGAKFLLEIGFGRSTKLLARVAVEDDGKLICCDKKDYSYLLSPTERQHVEFINGYSNQVWARLRASGERIDMAFLDYFSSKDLPFYFSLNETTECLRYLRRGGILCVHDVGDERYPVRLLPRWVGWLASVEKLTLPYSQGLLVIRKRNERLSLLGHLVLCTYGLLRKVKRCVD